MLKRLSIKNYALIDALDISFPEHLVIITGETGAGKSILLGALSLLLGAKGDKSAIKNADSNCVVEAEFADESGETILRRVLTPQGRSRIFVNDEPADMEELKSLSRRLIDIHSQNSQLLLQDDKFQLSVLDSYCDNKDVLYRYAEAYTQLKNAIAELQEAKTLLDKELRHRDIVSAEYQELVAAHIVDGELEELDQEQKQLANAEEIKRNLNMALDSLDGDEDSVSAAIKEAYSAVGKIASFIPGLDEIVSRMESCRIEINDILSEIRIKEESVHLSQERLDFVDARISLIINLMRKHGVGSESELISHQHALQQQVGSVEDLEMRIDSLERRVKELEVKSSELRSELHSRRAAKADELADRLQQSIRNLEMPHAILQIKMTPLSTPDKSGGDDVRFYFSANGSAGIKELAKSASGGEISRIMLCIKALMAQHTAMPSIIFDEIDTGVSGSIADKIGGTIVKMGEQMQVFAITHLPQVASKGDAHFLVYKEFADNQATTHIKQLSHEERVKEIARMLSGAELTAEAMENAKVLMNHK